MKKKLLLGSAVLSLSTLLAVGALVGINKKEAARADAATSCTVYVVAGNSNWTSWNNRFCVGDGTNWSTATASPIDSDFGAGDSSNFNKAKIGSTTYNFQKITVSLNSGNWLTVQKYNSSGSSWEADGYASGDFYNNPQRYFDGANSIINKTNNVIYVNEYSGSPWLNAPWTISGYYYKVICKEADGTVIQAASLQQNGYTPADPTAPSGKTFAGWYTNSTLTSAWDGNLTADTTLYAKYSDLPALSTPSLTNSNNTITWAAVSNAQSYQVTVDGNTTTYATSAALEVAAIAKPGTHTISVKAIGDHVSYNDSAIASTSYTVDNGWYLVGSFQPTPFSEDLVGAVRMTEEVDDQSKTFYQGTVTVAASAQVEAVYSTDSTVDWQNWGSLVISPAEAAEDFPVNQGGTLNKSLVFTNAGSYTIKVYIENYAAHYVVIPNNYSASYKLSVGGSDVTLTHHSGNEYKAVVNLTRGETLSYKKNDAVVASTPKKSTNNNIDRESNQVIFSATSVTVYVDVVEKTIFAEGLPNLSVGYHVIKNGTTVISMTHNESPSDPSYLEYFTSLTSFAADDVLTFLDIQSSESELTDKRPCEFKITTINAGGLGDMFEVVSAGIKAKQAINTAVYLKLKSGADEVYFGSVSEALEKAEEFAAQFLTKINAICDTTHGTGTDVDDLAEEWGKQKSAFNNDLIEGAQNILKSATTSHDVADIRNMIAQYTYVIQKYGNSLGANPDFLQKGLSQSSFANGVLANTINPSNTIAIIVVISLVAVTSIGGYLFIRGRKHD